MKPLRFTLLVMGILGAGALGCGESITLPATGTIYGDLHYEDGSPAAGIEVLVEGTNLNAFSDRHGRFIIPGALAVDEAGMGKYYVVRGRGERNGTPVGFIVTHFKVKGQQSYSIGEVLVPPTGTISGYVNLEGTGDYSGVLMTIEGTSLEGISRWDGSYTNNQVPAHEGYLINCHKQGYWDMVLDTMPGPTGPAAVAVRPRETTHMGEATLDRMP